MWIFKPNSTTAKLQADSPVSWSKADLHLHTTYSDGLMTPEETLDIIAQDASLRVIAITDHDTIEGALAAREYARRHQLLLEVVIGQEVTTGDGDVLGLYLHTTLPRFTTAAAAIEAIHHQGGLAVAAHPFVFGGGTQSLSFTFLRLPFDAVEARHGCPLSLAANLGTRLLNRFGPRLAELGNSDSHVPYTAGQAFTWFPGSSGADLRQAIANGMVRPGGGVWKVTSMWQSLRVITERGWPTLTSDHLANSEKITTF